MNLNELTISQAQQGLQKKEFSCVELTQACLDQIKKVDSKVKAYITVTEDLALKQAEELDKKGDFSRPLSGIPAGIKDIFCTKGIKTTAGSKILENYIPPFSATVIQKISNPIILGKLNMDEFACGSSTETSYFGQTKNPWDLERVPGGSSGGSAAAVVADECIYSLGTDTGGSIRQPASLCGIVGLKPSYGRVSRYGVIAMASSLDQVGPLTKTVEDAAIILSQIAGLDQLDSTTVSQEVPNYAANLSQEIKGLKVGIPQEYFSQGLDPEVEKVVKVAVKKLEDLGAKIVEISLPYSKYALAVYYIIMPSELSANLERYDGVKYGISVKAEKLLDNYLQTRRDGFGPEIRRRIMLGTYSLSSGYYDAYYLQAQKVRTLVKQDFEKVFEKVDCIITPTSPTVAFKLGEKTQDPLTMYLSDIYTVSVNIAGLPGISIPCGFAKPKDGEVEMPVSLQIIGKQFAESIILQVAYNYEQATEWCQRKPVIE
ncbi:MAG: aspartyl/glutamyl-tRNA amidotransferase subunit A [Candidatus Buchananbacteria bacterium RIFCSPHIGHO2_01_FULL_39_8]|uniref:Glutamyl-tRNA(Gln) amidotransferase subunit A n=1 Tax=Candidatus Buchananbacteria bacterium RIFCSPHIGHO2_01_FULL_39_8 TaxID=1797533 RepID=A0A1G1Y040_9BACT|nr:MAG: aspartyl/glutamyl-tRNA amidotransferase subunit A [Candidatus Buchananbacteria bacterium RIFCSPHIGHO2_01_FULL_39_8]